ncbi:MAG: hypothetical protein DRI39_02125 [Chloroflexi bacterium]|nr:MAG: hypothetical protein DRI39_02125 [Chloroflexota bacterium]
MNDQPGGTQQLSLLQPQGTKEEELAARIRKGNKLLLERWRLIRDMEPGEKRDKLLAGWDRGVAKLHSLCDELASLDGRCAYQGVEPPTEACLGCSVPNECWSKEMCPAWKLDL